MRKFFMAESVVKEILEDIKIARTDDNFLYITYWQKTAPEVSFIEFFKSPGIYGGLTYKTIERARRKLQNKYPELRDSKCADARFEESMKYEQYAING